jgi:hypothetical protein
MKNPLFVADPPTSEGFPTHLLPLDVAQVLFAAGFRVIARMDDRRLWLEAHGIDMGTGTPSQPDFAMVNYSLVMEVGMFGMHIVKHVLMAGRMPYSGMVYSGKTPMSGVFMKLLLAHCVSPSSKVCIDEEQLSLKIENELQEILDAVMEVNVNWLPLKQVIEVWIKHEDIPGRYSREFSDTADVSKLVVIDINRYISCPQP